MIGKRLSRRKALRLVAAISGGLVSGWAIGSGWADYVLNAWQVDAQSAIPTSASMPTPVPREAWSARAVNHAAPEEQGFTDDPYSSGWYVYSDALDKIYRTVAIHHSAMPMAWPYTMRDLQTLHMDGNQWADIGYHYGIDKNGVMYALRDIHVRGVSVAGHNSGVIGVVVMGNFERERPLDVQLVALQTLVNWLTATYHLAYLAGHNEFNPETECPGRHLSLYLDLLARGAGLKRGTQGYVSPAKASPGNSVPVSQEF